MKKGLNRRGLSQVVTTVLIILLVLAAVVIIWAVINPTLQDAGGKITRSTECLSLELQVESCTPINAGADLQVQVRRGPGAVSLQKLRFIIDGTAIDSDSASVSPNGIPSELETATYNITNQGGASEVDVGGILSDDGVCEPVNRPVTCT